LSDNGLIPITDEQAKLLREIVRLIRAAGAYGADVLGDLPKDLVGLLAGDQVKVWRAERLAKFWAGVKERLKAQRIEEPPPPNPKLALPILAAVADETNDELRDLWERLLAAAMNPDRTKHVRLGFIDALRKMDPLDALVMRWLSQHGGGAHEASKDTIAADLRVSRDQVEVSLANLMKLDFAAEPHRGAATSLTPLAREFLRATQD
jgi:hypothetical protein